MVGGGVAGRGGSCFVVMIRISAINNERFATGKKEGGCQSVYQEAGGDTGLGFRASTYGEHVTHQIILIVTRHRHCFL